MSAISSCPNCLRETTVLLRLYELLATTNRILCGVFCLCVLVYLFIGLALISNVLMNAIETITSKMRQCYYYDPQRGIKIRRDSAYWNKTVATLSLMSFGSASPEILLATIEIIENNFQAGSLGPETIMGASLFNTLVITAFCVIAVPRGQTRRIELLSVFWLSTAFSICAYVWLYVILNWITPNEVTLFEASITVIMFPIMLFSGYLVDQTSHQRQERYLEFEAISSNIHSNSLASQWSQQFHQAFVFVRSNSSRPLWLDYLLFYCKFQWNVLYAFIPPVRMLSGWITFFVSILIIAVLTAIVGDLANTTGCYFEASKRFTGLTIVAIGTSLPDLFTSRIAAKRDTYADSAIGNINGSNAFNVFLGFGFPWLCAAIAHRARGTVFTVSKLEGLGPSVGLFVLFSLISIIILTIRRKSQIFGQAELGGHRTLSYITFLVLLVMWAASIIVSLAL